MSISSTYSALDLPDWQAHNSPRLSADGTLVALASGLTTNVYENGVLVDTLAGTPLAWFDDDRLLVELDEGWRIYDSSRQLQPTPNLTAGFGDVRVVSATEIYSQHLHAIYSVASGEEVWNCDGSGAGAAAANYAVFVSDRGAHKAFFDYY